jgi:hypothetical protein
MEEWLQQLKTANEDSISLAKRVPLGLLDNGEIAFSQSREKPFNVRHTCVSGEHRTAYILSLLCTLNELYGTGRATFLIVSPKIEYGVLLNRGLDITLPFVLKKADLTAIQTCVCEIVKAQEQIKNYPRLVLVLDGLESVEDCNAQKDFAEYRAFFELLARRENVDIITGVDLLGGVFEARPQDFIGAGHCLIAVSDNETADVVYSKKDGGLTLPISACYPSEPSIAEVLAYVNGLD